MHTYSTDFEKVGYQEELRDLEVSTQTCPYSPQPLVAACCGIRASGSALDSTDSSRSAEMS